MEKKKKSLKISLRPAPDIIETIIVVLGVVMVWRGIWGLLDEYLFPNNPLLSCLISLAIGLILIYLPDQDLKELV